MNGFIRSYLWVYISPTVLGIFEKLKGWRALPFAAAVAAFSLFFYLEGYFDEAGQEVLAIYAAMALLCIFFSNRCSIDWNAALVVVSIALGGYMELVGDFAGIWSYNSLPEGIPIFITIAGAINAGAVQGIAFIAGVDLSRSTAGAKFEDRSSEANRTGSHN